MKEMCLFYNSLHFRYIFNDGKEPLSDNNRHEIPQDENLLERLLEIVDLKRNSLLHLYHVSEEVISKIEEALKRTKVKVQYEQ